MTYVVLMKYTDQGLREMVTAPRFAGEINKLLEAVDGKMVSSYLVMGEYDRISIIEVPHEEAMMTFLLRLGARGNVRTTTFRAFRMDEFEHLAEGAA